MQKLSNTKFLEVISLSFEKFINTSSRSNEKLKPLHGALAKDLAQRLGKEYSVYSLGHEAGKEKGIQGRYINKKTDIAIYRGNTPIAGIAVKFVMQNYSQNSNNYFENMLGETANIRCNNVPYFQVFIILDELPYYKKDNSIEKWETFTNHNAQKYMTLSQDNADIFFHTPNKTLICIVHAPREKELSTKQDYVDYYRSFPSINLQYTQTPYTGFQKNVIFNDINTFMDKVYYAILAI